MVIKTAIWQNVYVYKTLIPCFLVGEKVTVNLKQCGFPRVEQFLKLVKSFMSLLIIHKFTNLNDDFTKKFSSVEYYVDFRVMSQALK